MDNICLKLFKVVELKLFYTNIVAFLKGFVNFIYYY